MAEKIFQVDSFTHKKYRGNPAGVCLLEAGVQKGEEWYLAVAQEMNLSETAFIQPEGPGFRLRWFTPTVEVELCGHATLASAHILWSEGIVPLEQEILFYTLSGELTAQLLEEGWIQLNFPVLPYQECEFPLSLEDALGTEARFVAKSSFDYVVEVESAALVRNMRPNMALLTELTHHGVIVTARSDQPEYDFISRVFCPSIGVNEDPVTGSAHCTLAVYWQKQLAKEELVAYQASARGGEVRVRVEGERVLLRGQTVTTIRGELV